MGIVRKLLAGTTILVFGASVFAGATGLAYLKSIAPTLPDHMKVAEWRPPMGMRILAADGSLLGVYSEERRKPVSLDDIPPLVVNAFLAAEDRHYWRHQGIDPVGIVRAALSNLRERVLPSMLEDGHRVQGPMEGGSSITQQVVKNILLTSEQTFDRKIREAILAMRIDRDVGKRRVLEVYLNKIYFGAGAYGVAEAARTFFSKDLSDLTVGEAATLAGLPKAPSDYNPFRNPAAAEIRRNYVLRRMADDGFITRDEADQAMREPIKVVRSGAEQARTDPSLSYPREEIRRRIEAELAGRGAEHNAKDLIIRTTIRPDTQKAVHAALRRGLVREDRKRGWGGPLARGISLPVDWSDPRLAKPERAEDWEVGVVIEVGRDAVVELPSRRVTLTGRSLSWTGRSVARDLLRVGDAILVGDLGNGPELVQIPRVQGAAVVMDPASGGVLAISGGFGFSHARDAFNRATQASRQSGSAFKPFIYLAALELGYDATSPVLDSPIVIAPAPGQPDWRPKNSNDRGVGLITLRRALEQSRNLSTIRLMRDIGEDAMRSITARVGLPLPERFTPSAALGTEGVTPLDLAAAYAVVANGGRRVTPRFITDAKPADPEIVVDPIAAAQLSSILRGVVSNGTASRAFAGFDRPIAAKTGTTNGPRDVWFVAYGPRVVVTVWVGNDDFSLLRKGASGAATAAPIARDILDHAPGIEFEEFPLPEGAEEIAVKRSTGERAEDGDVIEIVRRGSSESLPDGNWSEVSPSTTDDGVVIDVDEESAAD